MGALPLLVEFCLQLTACRYKLVRQANHSRLRNHDLVDDQQIRCRWKCPGGHVFQLALVVVFCARSHQQWNLSTKCPFYLKSHPYWRKGSISEYDKKQRIPKDVICDLYNVINGRPVLIFLGELYIFWPKYRLEPDSIYIIHLFQKSPQSLCWAKYCLLTI